jgi:hypothetical protein
MGWITQNSGPPKADITRMYVGHNVIPNGNCIKDIYLFMDYNRFGNTGDVHLGFELNQSTPDL